MELDDFNRFPRYRETAPHSVHANPPLINFAKENRGLLNKPVTSVCASSIAIWSHQCAWRLAGHL
jgi:putative intracellular protease/amidase